MFSRRSFTDQFRCHSVSLLAAEQQREVSRLEYSDKIILPPSCLERLAQLEIQYPMIFEIANPRYLQRRLHCGVLEFIAQEGMVYLPFWMVRVIPFDLPRRLPLPQASVLTCHIYPRCHSWCCDLQDPPKVPFSQRLHAQ